ncbi:DICT sensory domain-containing protein [Rhodococcus sp. 14-2483-1-2]|uniref:DICT sensory domain-containing protein n=1 Tax=Rhodococcus sp. 14-2483-1-2 TaxID=2023147 RepID=UPI00113FE8E8|nr:DICT sensory domain-containing protein [Rhodococcus sp. 14-2483-1-2]
MPERPSVLLGDVLRPRTVHRGVVTALALMLESAAIESANPVTVLADFHSDEFFTSEAAARFTAMAAVHPFVAVLGTTAAATIPGLRSAVPERSSDGPAEWSLVIIGTEQATALIVRELHRMPGHFEYALTHHRDLVAAAGRSLIARLLPDPEVTQYDVPRPESS